MPRRRGPLLAAAALIGGFLAFLALTGPPVDLEAVATVRRSGGVCLELERWTLFGWSRVGQTHSVEDMQSGRWQAVSDDPPCVEVEERVYLVRVFAQPPGEYRLCGLADDRACIQFRRVEP